PPAAPPAICTLSLPAALPIWLCPPPLPLDRDWPASTAGGGRAVGVPALHAVLCLAAVLALLPAEALAHASDRGHVLLLPTGHYLDRKSTRLNSSHVKISYAVF